MHIFSHHPNSSSPDRKQAASREQASMDSVSAQDNGSPAPEPLAPESQKRKVEVVTVPAKNIGRFRSAGLRLASWLFGSPMTWAMHWAIRVDGTYFELNRPGGMAKPCLRASRWSQEKEWGIIAIVPFGSTTLSDDEIVAASEPYFTEKTRLMWYNLYINNCQLFVQFSLERITMAATATEATPPALRQTIGLVMSMAIYLLSYPPILCYTRWLQWRGCDQRSLQIYSALYFTASGMIWPMLMINLSQFYYQLKSIFETESLLLAAWAAFATSVMASGAFLIMPILTFPVAKKRTNGRWDVSTRQKQNNEEVVEPEVKIEVTYPLLFMIIGAGIGVVLWVVVATPYLVKGLTTFLGSRLSFRSPLAFGRSVWAVLMTPAFDGSKATTQNSGSSKDSNTDNDTIGTVEDRDSSNPTGNPP